MNEAISKLLSDMTTGAVQAAVATSLIDRFGGAAFLLTQVIDGLSCARMSANVTPSDSSDLPRSSSKGLTVNADGNLSLVFYGMADGATPVIRAVKAGVHYPWHVKRITATGTTATGIAVYFD